MNNELRELEIQEKREIEFVLTALSGELVPYTDTIALNLELLAKLDFIFAKAALSRHFNCTEPKFNNRRYINIKDGRHPLLDPKQVVPINIYLGDQFDLLIVTGPNTGGKTVSLKTVGLFTLMGQARSSIYRRLTALSWLSLKRCLPTSETSRVLSRASVPSPPT